MNRLPQSHRAIRIAGFILAGAMLLLYGQAVNATHPNHDLPVSDKGSAGMTARHEKLEQIVAAKLQYYAAQYPDMNFVLLDSAGNFSRNMQALAKIIGQDPVPLDYEHPKSFRHELLMATLERIQILFQSNIGSATLFKPGKGALANRKLVCIVTMNPWMIAANDRAATRHLLEIPDDEFNTIPSKNYLDYEAHLKFALDHEIFHCLDTAYNKPIPMSHRKYWADYYDFKNESGADAFGALMNIAAYGGSTTDARKLRNIRGLTLLCGDIDHYTYQSISGVLKMDSTMLVKKSVRELFTLASSLRDKVVGNYQNYVRFASTACHAMKRLGVKQKDEQFTEIKPASEQVKALVRTTRQVYRRLTGHELPVSATCR